MHATFRQSGPADTGQPIQGTFYPSGQARGAGSIVAALPKLLAVLVAMAVIRNVVGAKRRHGGSSRMSGRREAIAQFHRELHAEDAAAQSAEDVKA